MAKVQLGKQPSPKDSLKQRFGQLGPIVSCIFRNLLEGVIDTRAPHLVADQSGFESVNGYPVAVSLQELVTDRPTAHETQSVVTQLGPPNADANARLLAAAYNAFDSTAKKLGINAVEFAERMQDGEITTMAECLKNVLSRFHSCIADGNGKIKGDEEAMARAGQILDKVKGGAA